MDHKKLTTEAKAEIQADSEAQEKAVKKVLIPHVAALKATLKESSKHYNEPDHKVYNADGSIMMEGFSKHRIDQIEGLNAQGEFLDKFEKAIEDGSYEELLTEAVKAHMSSGSSATTNSNYYTACDLQKVVRQAKHNCSRDMRSEHLLHGRGRGFPPIV